ncbi:PorT family protein [Flavobacterium psychrophilum]|uniref:PorT family protein n=1 Tax=Flavobacterium psychrophilum TaxID=96345 RepID=A0A8G2G2Z1_FLAPS|nr:outer membrane beta-barrel protein [Flavobacterium psychrophilum]EKT3958276.1 PorT family protein [Flavobacterium psychrophilum]EKT4510589.1 PorT family protein [Flavobacterium psychrophilum]ELM3645156.1 PorT family protein [Flavobacterium psychrophilum]ELM3650354.1 PorT family protein [Flavobacterium psychrophilum]ELM3671783.1 PorT family protein [Flavobacterium psychrophilum]
MQKKHYLCAFLFSCFLSYSQIRETFTYGLKIGGLQSTIGNLPEMITGRDNSLAKFTLVNKEVFGIEGGLFLNYKLPNTRVAIQAELLYRKSGDKVSYDNLSTGKSYELSFNYSYLTLGAIYKIYPLAGLNAGVGAFYSKNITPSDLEYKSNEYDGLYDTEYRQFYRDAILGKDDFSLAFSLGYEVEPGLHFDVRYYLGLSDVVSNKTPSFQFIENNNRTSIISICLGYSMHQW